MTDKIKLAHGGGGKLSSKLIEEEILSRFRNIYLTALPDGATLPKITEKIVFTTDSYVVTPVEFPGGNIGDLAVHGTINDIAVSGGKPLWLSIGLILEEGLELSLLRKILDSIKKAAKDNNVEIVTGDTKVVAKGQCDKIFINSAGIGIKIPDFKLGKSRISIGDRVIVSGPIGDHGMAILCSRENIDIENGPKSDTASVYNLVKEASQFKETVKFMRDPTRGGIAAILNEIVSGMNFGITIYEDRIPVNKTTASISEMLGIEPINLACEGRVVAICNKKIADQLLECWKGIPEGKDANIIGEVTEINGKVIMETITGGKRLIDTPYGELLPRIC